MKATRDGVKGFPPRRAGGGQAMKWLTVALCFILLLFYGHADVIEGYNVLKSSAVRLLRSEGLPDRQLASGVNASQRLISHMPRTLSSVSSNANSSKASGGHTLHNLTALANNLSVSSPLTSQASSRLSSAAPNVSVGGPLQSSALSNISTAAGSVFISEFSRAHAPPSASLTANASNVSERLTGSIPNNSTSAARRANTSDSTVSRTFAIMASAAGNVSISAPVTSSVPANISSAPPVQAQSSTDQYGQGLQQCTKASFAQIQNFTGRWVDSPKDDFSGFYTMLTDCPSWVHEYDCKNPSITGGPVVDPAKIRREYRQVFQADQCQLRNFDARDFSQQMRKRKLIMVGDSIMRLHFYSLACLMNSEITSGAATDWKKSAIQWQGNYTAAWAEQGPVPLVKQFVGDFATATGFEVHLRDTGTYNDTLLEQVLSDFFPLQADDVLLINWGAWYPRWSWGHNEVGWRAWQQHMDRLFPNLLAKLPLQVIWKQYAPAHYGGATGAEVGFEQRLPGGPWQYGCEPSLVGEFWFDEYIKDLLQGPKCKDACGRIKVLPIFEMSRQRPNSHHGALGRAQLEGRADCRHWCNSVTDWWTILLYNMLT